MSSDIYIINKKDLEDFLIDISKSTNKERSITYPPITSCPLSTPYSSTILYPEYKHYSKAISQSSQ